jgi:outer membrane lipoprotein SlyB
MRNALFIAILLCALITAVAPAIAGELEGKVRSISPADRTITLDNGETIVVPQSMALDQLKQGAEVKVSFEESDGKKVATDIELK